MLTGSNIYLNSRPPLYEEILQSSDALLQSVHGDLAATTACQSGRELAHVLVKLVPADTQSLSFCLNSNVDAT